MIRSDSVSPFWNLNHVWGVGAILASTSAKQEVIEPEQGPF